MGLHGVRPMEKQVGNVIMREDRLWPDADDALLSRCWCDKKFVWVPGPLVRRNLTFPCELDRCVNMAREHGWVGPKGRRTSSRQPVHNLTPEEMAEFYED